jgi:endonuclease/exonuclease/phosphatase family metal-dependent hydrolase
MLDENVMNLKVMSFNIRCSTAQDGINTWKNRFPLVVKIIQKYSPTFIGFQELCSDQLQDLKRELPQYRVYGVGRDDGQSLGEQMPIFYNHALLLNQGTFWLSDSPDIPGSRWNEIPRTCTWGHFLLENGQQLALYNTHLDHLQTINQERGLKLILDKIQAQSTKLPQVLMGDFNCSPFSNPYNIVASKFSESTEFVRKKESAANNIPITFHNYSGTTSVNKSAFPLPWIDYIWIRGQIKNIQSCVINDTFSKISGIYPSDHWPIMSELSLEQ